MFDKEAKYKKVTIDFLKIKKMPKIQMERIDKRAQPFPGSLDVTLVPNRIAPFG